MARSQRTWDSGVSSFGKRFAVWTLVVLLIVFIAFVNYRYIQEQKERAFVAGGQNAIRLIVDSVQQQGGMVIEYDNVSIVLSEYTKPVNRTNVTV